MLKTDILDEFTPSSVAVLGSTGSVGTQTMDVIRELGIDVSFLTAGENMEVFAGQIKEFKPRLVSVGSPEAKKRLVSLLSDCPEIIVGEEETADAVRLTDADIIMHSVSGLAGTKYALAAAESGKRIGMANKEAVISLGEVIFEKLYKSGGTLVPVDSEHSAIYRCLEGRDRRDLKKIVLTASGGPFFGKKKEELETVTLADTLAHPTWKMGKKITIDSATLMNKGFEIIEAVKLFGVTEDRVDVIIHRQSIIHSMVEWNDSTLLAQIGRPDMRDCIRYAVTAPHTAQAGESLDFAKIRELSFFEPDYEAFPLLMRAREAARCGGTMPASLIAADEAAVEAFMREKISFTEISSFVEETLSKVSVSYELTPESAQAAEEEAVRITSELIGKR